MQRILIIDDEKSIRITLSEFLRQDGYDVETAEDAETALALMNERKFDVVITDIILPKITGIELLQSIRSKNPETQVIMITGEPTVDTAAQALRLGACDYLYKPVDKGTVLKTVTNAVKIKELEDANRNYRENLEQLVKERTMELRQAFEEQECMRQKMIKQERLTAMGKMASGIAHDINNTLTPITMYAEALMKQEKNLCDDSRRYVDLILKAADDIESTTLRMREFYRGVEPAVSAFKHFPAADVLAKAVEMSMPRCRIVMQRKGIDIQFVQETEEGLPPILGVESEIREALVNLLVNAADSMFESGRISIQAEHQDSYIVIAVIDEGSGMNEEQMEYCCDPFYTTKGTEGTGLGLFSVYGIVQRHHGKLEIESGPGKGTCAKLFFQAGDQALCEQPRVENQSMASSMRILVIDDDEVVRDCLQETLEINGYDITTAANGEEGIKKFLFAQKNNKRFDVVMTDLGMPGMDGRNVAAKIKEIDVNVPVVLLSGWGKLMKEKIEENPDIAAVLGKPPKLSEIQNTLSTLVLKRREIK